MNISFRSDRILSAVNIYRGLLFLSFFCHFLNVPVSVGLTSERLHLAQMVEIFIFSKRRFKINKPSEERSRGLSDAGEITDGSAATLKPARRPDEAPLG